MLKFFQNQKTSQPKNYTDQKLTDLDNAFSRFCQQYVTERESHLFDHLLNENTATTINSMSEPAFLPITKNEFL